MRQHHVATPSSPKPLLRLLSAQPFLRQAPSYSELSGTLTASSVPMSWIVRASS